MLPPQDYVLHAKAFGNYLIAWVDQRSYNGNKLAITHALISPCPETLNTRQMLTASRGEPDCNFNGSINHSVSCI